MPPISMDPKDWRDLPEQSLEDLWLIDSRDDCIPFKIEYEPLPGGFVPAIPYYLMKRFTKPGWTVYDPMAGALVTRRVGDKMQRDVISVDIADRGPDDDPLYKELIIADARTYNPGPIDLIIWHPPYRDRVEFTDDADDLSNMKGDFFLHAIRDCMENFATFLKQDRMLAIVLGNIYENKALVSLPYQFHHIIDTLWKKRWRLKAWIVKDIRGNRQGKGGLWRYRACASDSTVFRYETILVYKKES